MPIVSTHEFPSFGSVLGLDPGTKTIGVAASDPGRRVATPIETIIRKKFKLDAARLFALFDDRDCTAIVLGMPVQMDGKEGSRAQSVRAFARNLLSIRDVHILLWDERLSSSAVERILIEADTRRDKRKQVIDKLAAAYILQGALDFLRP